MAVRLAGHHGVLGSRKGCEIALGSDSGSDLDATQMVSSAAGGWRDYRFRYRVRSLGSYLNPTPLFLYTH